MVVEPASIVTLQRTLQTLYMVVSVIFCNVLPVEARLPYEEICTYRCKCDEILLRVNCTSANFNDVPDIPRNTRALVLDNNLLSVIEESFFVTLTSLRYLSLAWNQIDDIQDGGFRSQKKVMKLDLRHNRLGEVPLALKHLKSLIELDLSWNQIGILTNKVHEQKTEEPWSNITNLSTLRLDHNVLTLLPVVVFSKLVNLQYLSVSNNHLTALPDGALANLNQLEYINLSFNNLTSVSKSPSSNFNETTGAMNTGHLVSVIVEYSDFVTRPTLDVDYVADDNAHGITTSCFNGHFRIRRLIIQNNQLMALLRGIFHDLVNLEYLYLERNRIGFIQRGTFDNLVKLRELYLQENALEHFPRRMFEPLRNLVILNLDNNILIDITPLSTEYLFSLRRLSIRRNNLKFVPFDGFTRFQSLEELYVNGNQLQKIPRIKGLSQLRFIDLSFNEIREITPIDAFAGTQLEVIDLRRNSLETISFDTFAYLNNLRIVRLAGSNYVCDCRLQWALDYSYKLDWMYDTYNYPDYKAQIDVIRCQKPRVFVGLSLQNILWSGSNNHKLRCTTYVESHAINILLSSWGAILVFFLLMFWIHTFLDFKRKFGVRRPKKRFMAKHYATNAKFTPFFDESGQITFRTFDSDVERFNVVDEETTV